MTTHLHGCPIGSASLRSLKGTDQLVAECKGSQGEPLPKILTKHAEFLDDFIGELQAAGLAPGTISNHVKGVKTLYRASRLRLDLPYRLTRRVIYKDRAPTPEELQQLIDLADLTNENSILTQRLQKFSCCACI